MTAKYIKELDKWMLANPDPRTYDYRYDYRQAVHTWENQQCVESMYELIKKLQSKINQLEQKK